MKISEEKYSNNRKSFIDVAESNIRQAGPLLDWPIVRDQAEVRIFRQVVINFFLTFSICVPSSPLHRSPWRLPGGRAALVSM